MLLEMLRNRTYLGEVFFRGTWHRSADQPFIDPTVFDRVQAILSERGEGYGHRFRARDHEYLFTGLVTCGRCEHRYVGVSARGRSDRYRYYTCWNRNRRGKQACTADNVRADALEQAVLNALADLYADPDALLQASEQQIGHTSATAARAADDAAALAAEIRKIEASIERWIAAFEDGTLNADAFAHRVRQLTERAEHLRARHAALVAAATAHMPPMTNHTIAAVHRDLVSVTTTAPDELRKAVAQAFVHDLRVERKDLIVPTFRVLHDLDAAVRTMTTKVGADGLEPPTSTV
jgi:site-specific DNA recombinase